MDQVRTMMRSRSLVAVAVLAAALDVTTLAGRLAALPPGSASSDPSTSGAVAASSRQELSPKSTELVDHRCVGDPAEDDLTLFANGTVRLRDRTAEREDLLLAELERPEVD